MKQFNLQEYLANPSRQVVTREGKKVRIVCTDRAGLAAKPIVALITLPNGDEVIKTFWDNGIETAGSEDKNDLFFAPEKHEGWINIFKHFPNKDYLDNCSRTKSQVFKSKESAEKEGKDCLGYITTIKIERDE